MTMFSPRKTAAHVQAVLATVERGPRCLGKRLILPHAVHQRFLHLYYRCPPSKCYHLGTNPVNPAVTDWSPASPYIPSALAVFAFVLRTPVPRRTVNSSISYLRCGLCSPHPLAVVAGLEFGGELIVHLRRDVSGWRPTG